MSSFEGVRRIHLLGIAGTGMGSFAGLLKARGYDVTGSDENVYPPMSDQLRAMGIEPFSGYRAENLELARPDLVVVGNVIRAVNPEAAAVRERGIRQVSFPEALGALFLAGRHSVVVTGTHGKTTTTALLAFLLHHAGRDPSFLVGGVPLDFGASARLGGGPHFVVEGDEYDTAYFDKGPKFLHYRPRTALMTSVELDHVDIYRDLAHYRSSFWKFATLLPADGALFVGARWPDAIAAARSARCLVETYAAGAPADWLADRVTFADGGARFALLHRGREVLVASLRLGGRHNVENAAGAAAAALSLGLSSEEVARGLGAFQGVKRRQELRGEVGGVVVIDDFAHHPTAVSETIRAVAGSWPGRRLWAIFEPRSNTARRSLHQAEYAQAFAGAALAVIADPTRKGDLAEDEALDTSRLAGEIAAAGTPAVHIPTVEAIVAHVAAESRSGDVLLVMSNGAFGGIHHKLLDALANRVAA